MDCHQGRIQHPGIWGEGSSPLDFGVGLTFELQIVTGNVPRGVKGHHEKRSFISGRLTGLVTAGLIQEGLLKGRS